MSSVTRLSDPHATTTRINLDPRSIDELDAAICRIARHLHAETYRLLMLVREFDDRFGFAKWSFKSCAEWLAWRCQISLSAAREKVRTAQALRQLPAISAAFAAGRLSYTKVRALTRVAGRHDEDLLLAYALSATAPQVEERCRQIRNVRPESTAAARDAIEQRSLTIARNRERGTLLITVELPAEDGELVARALDKAVAGGEVALGQDHLAAHGETRNSTDGWRAQQADALVAIARGYLRGAGTRTGDGKAPGAVADHYQLVVHVDEKSLRGGAGRADLPLETIRRLGCDGQLLALVEDDRGRPLALGRKRRVVSPALRKALFARDGGCTFPGCHRKHYVDAHHLKHWANGGRTEPDNLTLLCAYHHSLLHEGGFSIRRNSAGALDFQRADGRTIPHSGYQLDDLYDDPEDALAYPIPDPSAEGSCTDGVREAAGVYRLHLRH